MKPLREATVEALLQVHQLVVESGGIFYNKPSAHIESGIGKHVRHILDHFLALHQGIENGNIDYNSRQRDIEIENGAELALRLIKQLIEWFTQPNSELKDCAVKVESEIALKQQQNMLFDSSLSRELCITQTFLFVNHLMVMK